MRNGERRRLNRRIFVEPISLNGEKIRLAQPYYYDFAEGTVVRIEHPHLVVCPDRAVIDIGPHGDIPEHVTLLRVVTEDGRIVGVFRNELDNI